MSAEEIKSRISELDDNEKWRLEKLCEGIDDEHAPAHYPAKVSSGTCRTWRLTGLATMKPYTQEQFCPYLLGTAVEETSQQSQTASAFFAGAASQQSDEGGDNGDDSGDGDNGDGDNGGEHGGNPRLTAVIIIGAVVVAILVLGIGWVYRRAQETIPLIENSQEAPPVETRIVVEAAPTFTSAPTATPVPTARVEEIIQTATYPPPTDTPRPTHTPIPPIPLPVTATFSEMLDPAIWDISGDNYTYVNNKLSTRGRFNASTGSPDWANYAITLVLERMGRTYYHEGLEIQLHKQDDLNYIAVQFTTEGQCGFRWIIKENGELRELPQAGKRIGVAADCSNTVWRIEADGGTYKLLESDDQHVQFIDTTYSNGPISIKVTNGYMENVIESIQIDSLN